jgi:hypothetical protein
MKPKKSFVLKRVNNPLLTLDIMNFLSRIHARKSSSPVADYALHRPSIGESEAETLLLSYEWDESFENAEWRLCVNQFLHEVQIRGHEVNELPSPAFTPGEDFVQIEFLVDEVRTLFKCDYLLSLIEITSEDSRVIRSVWDDIGNKIGWVS